MAKFLGRNLWPTLEELSLRPEPKTVVAPYYSSDAVVRCVAGDVIIVDAEKATIRGRQTSADLLLSAYDRGVIVYSHRSLHAKILLTACAAIVSSANISASSTQICEAGALFENADVLRKISLYVDQLKNEATRLSRSDLEGLAAIPVDRSSHRTASKPSLLEALADDLSVLNEVTFGIADDGAILNTSQVRAAAQSKGWHYPPGATWFESVDEPNVLSNIRRKCKGRILLTFRVSYDEQGIVRKFRKLDPAARPYSYVLRVDGVVVSVFGPRLVSSPIDLVRDGKQTMNLLTLGLGRVSRGFRRRISNAEGVIAVEDLRELYQRGR